MKKSRLSIMIFTLLYMGAFCGCQKAPEVSDDGEIIHAGNSLETEIAAITEQRTAVAPKEVDCVIGTEENGLRIHAQMPTIPKKMYQMTLCADEQLNQDTLTVFLNSKSGNVKDATKEYLTQQEQERQEQEKSEHPAQTEDFLYSTFGDQTCIKLTDEEKEVVSRGHTSLQYSDVSLKQSCDEIYKTVQEEAVPFKTALSKKADRAKQMLLEQLARIGITEICIYEMNSYKSSDFAFFEIKFTPSYEGIGVASEWGQVSYGEVFPQGSAWMTKDGAAYLDLDNFCGQITKKTETGDILSFSQIEKILEKYLESGRLRGSAQVELTQAELAYYPILQGSEMKLELVWHIYIPMCEWIESEYEKYINEGAAWNLYINAGNGKLEKVE